MKQKHGQTFECDTANRLGKCSEEVRRVIRLTYLGDERFVFAWNGESSPGTAG